jgi:hypothetical protein
MGETGPELTYGGVNSVSVYPITGSTGQPTVVVNHYIDARGSSITREQFDESLKRVHRQSVSDALAISNDRQKRSSR